MLYRFVGISFLVYSACMHAAASSNSSAIADSSRSSSVVLRESGGKVSFRGTVVRSPVRETSSPVPQVVTVPSPDSPPPDLKLDLSTVGRIQSCSSLASQLSDRQKRHLDAIVPLTPTDGERLARLKEEFHHDIQTHLPGVAPTDVATVLAIMPSSSGSLHTSSDDEAADSSSSSKSSQNYIAILESIVEGLNRQLEVLTKVDTHNRLRLQEERQHRATEQANWEQQRLSLEADRDNQKKHTWAGYTLAALGFIVTGVTAGQPYFSS